MYNILNKSSASFRYCSQLSIRNLSENPDLSLTQKACLLCKHLNIPWRVQLRRESTVTHTSVNNRKKYKRNKTKFRKYADIIVVTEKSLSHKKATIQKLSSNEVKLLTTTNLNLNELYKLKEYSNKTSFAGEHSYNALTILEAWPGNNRFQEEPILIVNSNCDVPINVKDPTCIPVSLVPGGDTDLLELEVEDSIKVAIEEDVDIDNIKVENSLQPENLEHIEHDVLEDCTAKTSKDKKEQVKTQINKERVSEIAERTLAAYIEVCNNLKNPQRGLNTIYFHRGKAKKTTNKATNFHPMKNIKVYNTLLKGFGNAGNWNKIKEILKVMSEEGVELNVQSYVAIFDCLGRTSGKNNHQQDIGLYVKQALNQGITCDRILNEGIFLDKERDMVLKAMQTYDEKYVPRYFEPKVQYDNSLLNHLNCEQQFKPTYKQFVENGGLFTPDNLSERLTKQMKLEECGYVTVKSINARGTPTEEILKYRKTLDELYDMWEDSAFKAFSRDLATLSAQRYVLNIEPYMRSIPVRDIVKIIVDEAKKMAQGSETYSPTVVQLYRELGTKVYARYKVLRKQKTGVLEKVTKIHTKYCEQYAANHGKLDITPTEEVYLNSRQQWQRVVHDSHGVGPSLELDHQEWAPTILQAIGKMLYHIVMHDLKVDVNSMRINRKHSNYLPAFYTIFRTQSHQVKEEVKPHPILSRLYRASVPETLTFPAYEVPMLCPPVPWISTTVGGYLISPCEVVRLPSFATSQKNRMERCDPADLYPSLDALNQLAAVPWKVNKKILDVILEVFNNGGSSKLDVPEPPSSLPSPASITQDMDKVEKYQIFRQRLQHRRKKAEMYSLWCDCLYRLSLANHFKDDVFWLPHNMDFRGRVYPIPPHLNHLGSDLARSMLVFAESRPLGPRGLDWLKVHLINLTGLKKRDPVNERLNFANEMMPLIVDSADRPLTGRRWWAESDEPWQTLACCMEVADVARCGDPANYRSHFPVHQDGSCNGLQHYAALGRDGAGAFSVNLAPCDEPQDVYGAVVALVEERRARDAANGLEIAKVLDGYVKRKVIKQTIMTTVYGVTRFGARLQIARQLKDIDDFPKEFVWSASSYLTGQTFESLRTMFTSTREIQDWFTECARLISSIGNQHVEWVTPLGLPIVQPYFRSKKTVGGGVYENFHMDKFEKPNVMKQKNAFPPNFIHSLDSSHMMLTSLHCERAGITFVSVHDCYWTHPSTVHIMNQICREQFVALHSQPILEDLSVFLSHRYSCNEADFFDEGASAGKRLNRILRKLPATGDFDIKQVLKSIYFFS